MSTKTKKETELLEVEVLISNKEIESNPSIKEVYDEKTHKLKFEISKSIPKSFSKKLAELMPDFKGTDIIEFNPLVSAVNALQDIKILIPDSDDFASSERTLIDNNKIIGSFNSSLKTAKKIIKQPHVDYNKKVDELFKIFEEESQNTRNALENNFKEIIDERERVKKEKEDKKKEEELAKIKALTESNSEMEEKMMNQKITAAEQEIKSKIDNMIVSLTLKIPELNIDGLRMKLAGYKNITQESFIDEENSKIISEEKRNEFIQNFNTNKTACIQMIEKQINSILKEQELEKLKAKTNIPETPVFQSEIPTINNIEVEIEEVKKEPENDIEKFSAINDFCNQISQSYEEGLERIKTFQFEHPDLTKIQQELVLNQFPAMLTNLKKLSNYTNKKNEQIINTLK